MRDGEKRVSNLQKIIFLLIIKTRGRTAMKIKKVISLLCTAAMLLAVPAGNVYAGAEDQSVVVTMPTTSEPESGFDPAYGWGAGEHVHEPLIQSTLVRTTKDLGIENDLATEYSCSDDGLTWTVKIRDDVKFTDGEQLTASDVAFTFNTCRDESSVNDFTMLKEAVAVDDTTVEFHMNEPYSIWPYTMAIVGIVPEHAYDENYGQNPIGSGRYIMKQWDKGQQVIFEANPDYYGEAPKMKKVTVLFMEEDAALAAAQSGTVDVAHTAASYSDITVDGYDLFSVQTVDNRGFNLPATAAEEIDGVTYGNDFTSDVEVRRAINLGIDREEMIENVLNGYGTPAYSVCDKMPWYNEEAEVEYDPDKAKEILAYELTNLVHGEEEAAKAKSAAEALFAGGVDMSNVPTVTVSAESFGKTVLDVIAETKIVPSKAEGRRLIQQGGLSINGEKVTEVARIFTEEDIQDGAALIKRGKKNYTKIEVQ